MTGWVICWRKFQGNKTYKLSEAIVLIVISSMAHPADRPCHHPYDASLTIMQKARANVSRRFTLISERKTIESRLSVSGMEFMQATIDKEMHGAVRVKPKL
jgi:hypothetical protein